MGLTVGLTVGLTLADGGADGWADVARDRRAGGGAHRRTVVEARSSYEAGHFSYPLDIVGLAVGLTVGEIFGVTVGLTVGEIVGLTGWG